MSSENQHCCLKNESGTSLVEFAIVAPFLALIFIALVDIGTMLMNYLMLTQVAREGVRSAASLIDIREGSFVKDDAAVLAFDLQNDCVTSPSIGAGTPEGCGHWRVLKRMSIIMNGFHTGPSRFTLDPASIQYTSAFQDATSGTIGAGVENDDSVQVRINANYDGIFPMFDGLPLSVEAQGPFLYER